MRLYHVSLLFAMLVLGACGGDREGKDTATETEGPLSIYVVNYPLQYFAERIGGEHAVVSFPAPPDVDPAYWAPDAATITDYQSADLILRNGAGYASWIEKVTLPESRIVDTSHGFTDRLLPQTETTTHTHGPGGEHSHRGTAFTVWLDPSLAAEQAKAVAAALIAARPGETAAFTTGLEELLTDLAEWETELVDAGRAMVDRPVIFSHPVYSYLERACGLQAVSLHWEPDEFPDEGGWRELQALLETRTNPILVWEAAPLPETVAQLRDLGVTSVAYSPAFNRPADGDFMEVMRAGTAALRRAAGH